MAISLRPMLMNTSCAYGGPQQPTHLLTTGTMVVLDIVILKDIHLTTAVEALHVSPSRYSRIRRREGHTGDCHPLFYQLRQICQVFRKTTLPPCPSLPSTPALLDDAVAFFESALSITRTTAMAASEVRS
jgi:hypothetical protein